LKAKTSDETFVLTPEQLQKLIEEKLKRAQHQIEQMRQFKLLKRV